MRAVMCLLLLAGCAGAGGARPAAMASAAPQRWRGFRGQARAEYESGHFHRCADDFATASADGRDTGEDLFSAARCQALTKSLRGNTITTLERAAELGFDDLDALATDRAFRFMRRGRRWQQIFSTVEDNRTAYEAHVDRQLYHLYLQDRRERAADSERDRSSTLEERDLTRRASVRLLLAGGHAQTSADYVHAAVVMHHGTTPADVIAARELALQATRLAPVHPNARWLVAAAEDRLQMLDGEAQRYGTQLRVENGQWVVYKLDPRITDDERAAWDVPPIAVARARAAKLQEKAPPEPRD